MRPRSLLVLSLLVLALGAFIFFYEKDLPSTDERAELEKKVLRLEKDDVRWLEISWGERAVRLERVTSDDAEEEAGEDDGEEEEGSEEKTSIAETAEWRLAEPLEARADPQLVDGLLGALAELQKERTLEDADPADVGLDEPQARVVIGTAGGGETALSIGGEVPNANAVVVGVEGRSEAYQVASSLLDELKREPGDWRDKRLFPGASSSAVERLALEAAELGDAGRLILARRGERFWIESPLNDLADKAAVDALLGQLTGLEAERFVDATPPAETLGLEPPRAVVEMVVEGRETPLRLELGAASGEGDGASVYARAGGLLVEVGGELLETLAKPAAGWRSPRWTRFEVYQVDRLEVAGPAGEVGLTLRRDGADWKRGEERIPYSAASDFLYALRETEAESFASPAEAAERGRVLEDPRHVFTVSGEEGESEELRVFAARDGLAAATSDAREGVVLLVPEAAVSELEDKLEALRQAEPLPEEEPTEDTAEDAG